MVTWAKVIKIQHGGSKMWSVWGYVLNESQPDFLTARIVSKGEKEELRLTNTSSLGNWKSRLAAQ